MDNEEDMIVDGDLAAIELSDALVSTLCKATRNVGVVLRNFAFTRTGLATISPSNIPWLVQLQNDISRHCYMYFS